VTFAAPVAAQDPVFSVVILGSKPLEVTAGQIVAYPVEISGDNTMTINHVVVDASVPNATPLGAITTVGTCPTLERCDLGQFTAAAQDAFVVFMYRVPTDVNVTSVTATVVLNSGEGMNDDPGAAHGDEFSDVAVTNIHHGDLDTFFSRYVVPRSFDAAETGVVETDQAITDTNRHATRVTVPDESTTEFGAPATIHELPVNPLGLGCGGPCFGEESQISVADGAAFPEQGLTVQVTFGAPELPKGMTARKLHVVHVLDGGTAFELVDGDCAVVEAPCRLSTVTLKDKSIVVTLLLDSNGSVKGF
jgi:hypothetical protein